MMSILARHVNERKEHFVSHNVIRDLSRLIRTSSGRVEAGPGFHDDSIMSYLIGLYVYYHGNNLSVFGITPGMHNENGEKNTGLLRPSEINPDMVDKALIDGVMELQQKEAETNKVNNWEDMMREAIQKSQRETFKMFQGGHVQNTIFDNTPDTVIDDYESDGVIPMDFFTTINNL